MAPQATLSVCLLPWAAMAARVSTHTCPHSQLLLLPAPCVSRKQNRTDMAVGRSREGSGQAKNTQLPGAFPRPQPDLWSAC